jgi:hypothetical protein
MAQMPTSTHLLARAQLQHEQLQEQHHRFEKASPTAAASAASAASKAVDAIHHHLLSERISRIESAVATMAATVSQLVQLMSVAAEASPQAAAAIWSTAAQLTAAETPAFFSSKGGVSSDRSAPGAVAAESASPAREFSHTPAARAADGSCVAAAVERDSSGGSSSSSNSSSTGVHQAGSIAAPEFNLRHKIVRVSDLHERLCSIPSRLPAHEAVTVSVPRR